MAQPILVDDFFWFFLLHKLVPPTNENKICRFFLNVILFVIFDLI